MFRKIIKRPCNNLKKVMLSIESLEPRQLLVADLVISEFMAVNTNTIQDEDSEFSDWIELRNFGDTSQDITGWSLTNDPADLTKWALPSTSIAPGEHLLIYASGKNRSNPVSELHTNFDLPESDGYLALVQPNLTIKNDYGPNYPVQVADFSFGLATVEAETTLINAADTANVLIPSDASDLAANWNEQSFDDSLWSTSINGTSGSTGIGFESVGVAPAYSDVVLADNPTHYYRFEETTTITPAKDEIGIGLDGDHPGIYNGGITLQQSSAFASMGSAARFDGVAGTFVDLGSPTPFYAGSSATIETWVNLDSAAAKAFHAAVARWDGSFELDINGSSNTANLVTRNDSNAFGLSTSGTFTRDTWHHLVGVFNAGTLTVYLDGVQGVSQTIGGNLQDAGATFFIGATRDGFGSGFNWTGLIDEVAFYDKALSTTQIQTHFGAASGGPASDNFDALIQTDVESLMFEGNASALVRIDFNVDDPTSFNDLNLRMKYDDGFVAYLNGQEVARRNAPVGTPAWNDSATAEQSVQDAVVFEEIDIQTSLGALLPGNNVLAIHGLNLAADDTDFLILPELVAVESNKLAPDLPGEYLASATPGTENTQGSAGVKLIDNVVINEFVALNDGSLLDEDGEESDWIELNNAGPYAVDLDDSYLTDDVTDLSGWRFPKDSVILPGEYLVVFASSKDRNKGEFHTDFKLSSSGEYLGLVKPDALTVVSQYAPLYPNQFPDVSYGLAAQVGTEILVQQGDLATVLIPLSANDIPASWTEVAFDDAPWVSDPNGTSGPTAIGFDVNSSPAPEPSGAAVVLGDGPGGVGASDGSSALELWLQSSSLSQTDGTGVNAWSDDSGSGNDVAQNNAALQPSFENGVIDTLNGVPVLRFTADYFDSVTLAAQAGEISFVAVVKPNNIGAYHNIIDDDQGDRPMLWVDPSAQYEFNFGSPTGAVVPASGGWDIVFGIKRNTGPNFSELYVNGPTVSAVGTSNFTVGASEVYDLFNRDGGQAFQGEIAELIVYDTALTTEEINKVGFYLQDRYNLQVGFSDPNPPLLIATDIESQMHNNSSTALVRIPFSVNDLSAIDQLSLNIQYDDAFVAYVNGVEVARRNVSGTVGQPLAFDAIADAAHSPFITEQIDVSSAISVLITGTDTNVLSIHGVNRAATDDDFFILPELIATDLPDTPSQVQRYFVTPTPGSANATSEEDRGPVISDVGHGPNNVPAESEDLVVTATIEEIGNTASEVTLHYRVMFAAEIDVPMLDDGLGSDIVAGDGIYTAVIPATEYGAGDMIRYRVTSEDSVGNASRWPLFYDQQGQDQSDEYLGTVVATPSITSLVPRLQWFVAPDQISDVDSATKIGGRASLFYDGEFYDNVFTRTRGATSLTVAKKSYKFDFSKGRFFRYDDNLPRVEEFNVNTTFQDKSYVRESLTYETFRAANVPASDAFNLRVERNGQFFSVATFVEQVDERFLERRDLDPNGALYKMFNGITSAVTGVEKKSRLAENNSDLQQLVAGLAAGNPNRKQYVFDNIDIPAAINYMVSGILVQDFDRGAKNFYLYRDTDGNGLWTQIPWDQDLTFGNRFFSDEIAGDGSANFGLRSHPFYGESAHQLFGTNMMIDAILDIPQTREMYVRRLRTLMDDFLQPPGTPVEQLTFEAKLDDLFTLLEDDAALDLAQWGAIFGAIRDFPTAIDLIKTNYLQQRRTYLFDDHNVDNIGGGTSVVLINEATQAVTALVPLSSADLQDGLGKDWFETDFTPSVSWLAGTNGVGYDRNGDFDLLIGLDILSSMDPDADVATPNVTDTALARIPFTINGADLANPNLDTLTLRMKYDDGFVTYLNGIQVAAMNDPAVIDWNSSATADHPDIVSTTFENFQIDLTAFQLAGGSLIAGTNVLAIAGLNNPTTGVPGTSSDMLIRAELILSDAPLSSINDSAGIPNAQVGNPTINFGVPNVDATEDPGEIVFNPISGNQDEEYISLINPNATSVDISGWTLTGGVQHTFAAGTVIPAGGTLYVSPNENTFRARSTGPSDNQSLFIQGNYKGHISNLGETINLIASDSSLISSITTPFVPSEVQQFLRITEINYNPPGGGDITEFIELKNISDTITLNLTGVQITDGPSSPFDFTTSAVSSLLPGNFVLVVKNKAAFQSAYPLVDTDLIAGEFSGGLNNGGETIKLEDASSSTVLEFRYEDGKTLDEADWHPETDGGGFTLVIKNTEGDYGQGTNWRSSALLGGSPGAEDLQALTADFNGDGTVDAGDLAILLENYGTDTDANRSIGDANHDRKVSLQDLLLVKKQFNSTIFSSPLPAAAAASLMVNIDTEVSNNSTTRITPVERLRRTTSSRKIQILDTALENFDHSALLQARQERLISNHNRPHIDQAFDDLQPNIHQRRSILNRIQAHRSRKTHHPSGDDILNPALG